MPKTYNHLDEYERDIIAVLKSEGRTLREIARALKRDPGTLSRELKRNAPPINTGYYLGHQAHARAVERNRRSRKYKRLRNDLIRHYVEDRLRVGWSPELIAGRLPFLHPGLSISHEAVYQWIYEDARYLIPFLVRAHRKRKRRGYSRKHKKQHIPERVPIRDRPAAVDARRRIGHWEADTMSCRKSFQAIQVCVERKARFTKLAKLEAKTSRAMSTALIRTLIHYPQKFRLSITYDNGSENAEHLRTNETLGTRSFFCEPFHSYERGTVENTIGLIRRFIPKKTNLADVSHIHLKKIEYWLNNRPRKCLGFKTPAEIINAECCT